MKHTIKFGLTGGMILFCLSMSLTSCEDILGEWSKPVPNTVTPGGGDGGGSSTINATSLALDAILRLDKTTPKALTPTVTPSDAAITWESSDETIATVDATGKVTPIKVGKVTIKATSGDLSATSTVIVYDKIHNINTDGNASVSAGEWLIEGNGTAIANSITIGDGAKVTLNGINVTLQIVCSGTANIILADGSTNTVTAPNNKAGIQIGGTGTLTIDAETAGDGKLTVQGGYGAAGIGTNMNGTGGKIVINGGRVTATGGEYAAGIGTGYTESSANECGTITINGGTVNATGGDYGAGIGTGIADYDNTCGAIKINSGTVTATGGEKAAGIGTGRADGGTNTCGAITIGTGVKSVTATKGTGTGSFNSIGTGKEDGSTQKCGKIKFGTAEVFDGASPGTWDTMTDGNTYGGLKLAISGDTWTLTPAP